MNPRVRLALTLFAIGLFLVSIYVRTGGAGIAGVIPWLLLPPLVAYLGVEIARNALRQLGPPNPGTVFQLFAFWTVIVLAYQLAIQSNDDVRVGEFVARVFLISLVISLPYALAGLRTGRGSPDNSMSARER